jgi:hypothetical protein
VSIGVNVLIVPHLLAGIGFRATVLLAAGISIGVLIRSSQHDLGSC